jgi:hypothetical protein
MKLSILSSLSLLAFPLAAIAAPSPNMAGLVGWAADKLVSDGEMRTMDSWRYVDCGESPQSYLMMLSGLLTSGSFFVFDMGRIGFGCHVSHDLHAFSFRLPLSFNLPSAICFLITDKHQSSYSIL